MTTTEMIERLGFPIAIVVLLVYGAWHTLRYIGRSVVEPLVAEHKSFLTSMKDKATQDTENTRVLVGASEQQTEAITKILEMEVKEHQSLDELHLKVDTLVKRVVP